MAYTKHFPEVPNTDEEYTKYVDGTTVLTAEHMGKIRDAIQADETYLAEVDPKITELESAKDNVVLVQSTQPASEDNKIWIPTTQGQEVEVPTYDEFTDLKSAFNSTLKNLLLTDQIPFASGFIHAVNVGSVIDITDVRTGDLVYAVVKCSENDKFKVTGKGGASSAGSWYFTDENYTVLSKGANNLVMSDLELISPQDGFFIVNARSTATYSLHHTYPGSIENIRNSVQNIKTATEQIEYFAGFISAKAVGGMLDVTDIRSGAMVYAVVKCSENDKFKVTGTGGASSAGSWYFTDNNYLIISKGGNNITMSDIELTAPSDGYFAVNSRSTAPYNLYHIYSVDGLASIVIKNRNDISKIKTDIDESAEREYLEQFPKDSEFPLNIVHRGLATQGYPENSIVAYKDAISKGWKYLETDIRRTSDGVWVLLHDPSINNVARNADGSAISSTVNIADITYEQALDYDFGIKEGSQFAGTKIATFDAFLNLCNKNHVFPIIEIKDSSISQSDADAVWGIVEKYSMQNRSFFLCSSLGGVNRFTAKNEYIPCIATANSDWTYIDPATFPERNQPYASSYKTGKNKVIYERAYNNFQSKADMENFVEYCHYFGLYAGVYSPSSVSSISSVTDLMDAVTTQYFKYSDVMTDNIT